MSELSALELATEYLHNLEAQYFKVLRQGIEFRSEDGAQNKVWWFMFDMVEREPGEISCGGTFTVYVADATGECSHFAGI